MAQTKELDLFTPTELIKDIKGRTYQEFKPIAPLQDSCCLEFHVNPSYQDYLDLNETYLQVKVTLLNIDGTPLTSEQAKVDDEGPKVNIANLALSSIFSQCDVQLNQKIINPTVGNNYAYKSFLDVILHESDDSSKRIVSREGFAKQFSKDLTALTLSDFLEQAVDGNILTLEGKIRMEVFQLNKFIPNGVSLRVKLYQAPDAFRITSPLDKFVKLKLVDATLGICQVQLYPEEVLRQDKMFAKSPAVYDFLRSDLKSYQIAQGSYTAQVDDPFQGVIPNELLIVFTSSESYSGNFKVHPLYFGNYDLRSIECTINGQSQPGPAVKVNFKEGDWAHAFLNLSAGQSKPCTLDPRDFPTLYAIYKFNFQSHLPEETLASQQKGNLRINAAFGTALPEGVTLLIYAKIQDRFYIDQSRNIIEE